MLVRLLAANSGDQRPPKLISSFKTPGAFGNGRFLLFNLHFRNSCSEKRLLFYRSKNGFCVFIVHYIAQTHSRCLFFALHNMTGNHYMNVNRRDGDGAAREATF